MSTYQVWIVDDDSSIRWVLERAFNAANDWQPRVFSDPAAFLAALQPACAERAPDLVITDVKMPGIDGMQVLQQLQERWPDLPVIVMTAHSDLDSAVKAFKGGAFEYIPKPFDLNEVLAIAGRAVKLKQQATQPEPIERGKDTGMIGESPAMQEVFRAIGRLSRSSVTVLITGQTGTGKELVARALHDHSPRAEQPFVALNMAAIPGELIESELFGHEKGAFTGAQARRPGRFQQANGGTLFLDEIGDMPLAVQTRLLRALAEGQFYPVGSHQLVSVDVRVIAATHIDLRKAIAEGTFREDLYHRLNVIHLRLPTLAERRSDIAALTEHFLASAAEELQMSPKRLTADALARLEQAQWPGNVRQLENVCRWLTVMASGDVVDTDELPALTFAADDEPVTEWRDGLRHELQQVFATDADYAEFAQELEQIAIDEALKITSGHRQQAAAKLGWGRNTLTRKLARNSTKD
ncbi:MAG: nitrogen regulation protein NR(I) [Aliidiomarina sp.]|uniref:nitrogen regulation protein NR(I) n=1 Tax=Aliidiomarina sp. TaxID=1872439 RepID=UPI0025C32567|nr:nitrogen regulation protein NR(I) [Aliidiomarina sp.]MCH8500712.1 nitrogen regulation protein NR(I) [Aliidiomarina sp.]